jgi:hypothetical protein
MAAWQFLVQHGNSLGLLFDIASAVLITLFGLPPNVTRGGVTHLITQQTDTAEASKATRYARLGRTGLVLLIIGFGLQFLSSVVPR